MNSPHYILEYSNYDFRYVRLCDLDIPREKKGQLFANSGDSDQMPYSAASDLCLHCLPVTLLGVSRLQWVKEEYLVIILGYFFLQISIKTCCGYSLEALCLGTSSEYPQHINVFYYEIRKNIPELTPNTPS